MTVCVRVVGCRVGCECRMETIEVRLRVCLSAGDENGRTQFVFFQKGGEGDGGGVARGVEREHIWAATELPGAG